MTTYADYLAGLPSANDDAEEKKKTYADYAEALKPAKESNYGKALVRGLAKGATLGYVHPYEEEAKEFGTGEKVVETIGDLATLLIPFGAVGKVTRGAIGVTKAAKALKVAKGIEEVAKAKKVYNKLRTIQGLADIGIVSAVEKKPEEESRVAHIGKNAIAYILFEAVIRGGGKAVKGVKDILKNQGVKDEAINVAEKEANKMAEKVVPVASQAAQKPLTAEAEAKGVQDLTTSEQRLTKQFAPESQPVLAANLANKPLNPKVQTIDGVIKMAKETSVDEAVATMSPELANKAAPATRKLKENLVKVMEQQQIIAEKKASFIDAVDYMTNNMEIQKGIEQYDPARKIFGRTGKVMQIPIEQEVSVAKWFRDMIKEGKRTLAETNDPALKKEIQLRIDRLAQQMKERVDPTFIPTLIDKIVEVSTGFKMMSPLTHLRNIIGQTITGGIKPLELETAALIDMVKSQLTGSERTRSFGEGIEFLKGFKKGMPTGQDIKGIAKKITTDVVPDVESRVGEVSQTLRTGGAVEGKFGTFVRWPFRAIDAIDSVFKNMYNEGNIMSLAYRKAASELGAGASKEEVIKRTFKYIEEPSQDLIRNTMKSVRELLFKSQWKEMGWMGKTGKDIERLLNDQKLLKVPVPFFKTPLQIFKYVLDRSPAGFLSNYEALRAPSKYSKLLAAKGKPLTGRRLAYMQSLKGEQLDALSKISVGTGIAALFAMLAKAGYISGDAPDDKSERDSFYRRGLQPNSVKIGNKWVSFLGYEPLSSSMTIAANIAEMKKPDDIPKAVFSVVKNMTSQPYLTGIRDMLNAITEPERYGSKWITKTVTGMVVPNILPFATKLTDTTVRQPDNFAEAIASRTPFLSRTVSPRLDIFGKPITREMPYSAIASTTTEANDPVENELARLEIYPGMPREYVKKGKEKIDIPRETYTEWLMQTGPKMKQDLTQLVTSPEYEALDDNSKEKAINRVINKNYTERRKILEMMMSKGAIK